MLNAQLLNQAFNLHRELNLRLNLLDMPKLMRERLIHAKKRAYSRYGRRLGFDFA